MSPQLYIITGASRGLGLAQSAKAAGATLEQWPQKPVFAKRFGSNPVADIRDAA